ncbi:MAG: collagen binding domain-containing protein [Armatimonadota bacterium]
MFPRVRPLLLLNLACFAAVLTALPGTGASATAGDVAGMVKDAQGRGIPNATVRVQVGPAEAFARTDAEGAYRISDLPPGTYDLLALKPAYVSRLRTENEVLAGGTVTQDFKLEWATPAAGAVEVLVTNRRGGAPLPEAVVALAANNQVLTQIPSDEVGSAVFPGLAPGFYTVQAQRAGFRPAASRSFQVRAGAITAVTLRLSRDVNQVGRLGGVVRSAASGEPIRNAAIEVLHGLSSGSTRTGGDGRYELNKLIPGSDYSVQVRAPGFATQTVGNVVIREHQLTVLDFRLVSNAPTRGSIAGRVSDREGEGIPFAAIRITAGVDAGKQVQAGPDGEYVLRDLTPGAGYAIVAEQDGYSAAGRAGLEVKAGRTTVANVTLQNRTNSPGTLRGVVRDAQSGAQLPGVLVEIIQGPSIGLTDVTDGAGRYNIPDVVAGTNYTLRFTREGYQALSIPLITVAVGEQKKVDAELTSRAVSLGHLSGVVREFGKKGTLSGATVKLFQRGNLVLEATTNNRGEFNFRNLRAADDYEVEANKQNFVKQRVTGVEVRTGETTTVDLTLRRGKRVGAISGRVVDLLQRPIANAWVRVVQGKELPEEVRTDTRGRFRIQALPQGIYTLEAGAAGFRTTQKSGISVTPRRTTSVILQLLQ